MLSEIRIPNPSRTPDAPNGSREDSEDCEIDFDLFVNKYAAITPTTVAIIIASDAHINEFKIAFLFQIWQSVHRSFPKGAACNRRRGSQLVC